MFRNIGLLLSIIATCCVLIASEFAGPDLAEGGAPVGDANCDGSVNALDAAVILQLSAALLSSLPCENAADTNGDGQISALDSALVLQFSAGLINDFEPAEPTDTPLPPTATNTSSPPTPTNTPLPQPPTATPSTQPSGDVTTRNWTWYEDDLFGDIEIVGEVVNGLSHDIALVEVTANAYSASNVLLTTEAGFACVTAMGPGTDSPFDILMFDPPSGIDHIELIVTDYSEPPFFVFGPPVLGMSTFTTNTFTDSIDFRHVVGTATNDSSWTYDLINVCTAHYDGSGNVVRTGINFLKPDTLGPGQSGKFNVSVDALDAGIVSDRVWVDALYTDEPLPPLGSMMIRNSSWYEDDLFGDIEVVGEVVNNTGSDAGLVEVTANVFSASSTLLTSESSYACVSTMAPGTDSPFSVPIFDPPAGLDHIELHVTHISQPPFFVGNQPVVGLDTSVTNHFVDDFDFKRVVGTVTNNSAFTYEFVNVCAAFYDSSGSVVRTGLDFVTPDVLGPDEVGTFEVSADVLGAKITTERLWVDALYE